MTRSLAYSTGIHILILIIILVAGLSETPVDEIIDTVEIRIRRPGGGDLSMRAQAVSPSESQRSSRQQAEAPQRAQEYEIISSEIRPEIPERNTTVDSLVLQASSGPQTPAPERAISGLGNPDPLSGIDEPFRDVRENGSAGAKTWSLDWEAGKERGILVYPEMEKGAVPDTFERLLDVEMTIVVSPQGQVLAVELIPPGSGDIRIDRYVHSLALQLVMEPTLSGEQNEKAVLRLVFAGGSS